MRAIARTKGEAFYNGEIAHALAKFSDAQGGALTVEDLAAYQPEWVTPISRDYRGHTLHEIPPNGQGIAALIALGILEKFDMASLRVDSVASQHLQIEAMKLAFADVYRFVADPRHMECSGEQLLDADYLAARARLIDPQRAQHFGPGYGLKGGTIYLSVADEAGMMVSFIQSNYMGFGSGLVVPGTGIALQNRGHNFSVDPSHDNCVAPGKKPYHTIIPGFLTRGGEPVGPFGVMGGFMQPQGHLQMMVNTLTYGLNPQASLDAPRWQWEGGRTVGVEHDTTVDIIEGLQARGHDVVAREPNAHFGRGQIIWRLPGGGYLAGSDKRADGAAVGF